MTPPLHGYRGDPTPPPIEVRPCGPTVAVSRQAGARGSTVAEAVGRRLGWTVVTQELLDFLSEDDPADLECDLPDTARIWAAGHWQERVRSRPPGEESQRENVSRRLFALAARGNVVVVGRAAGHILPAESTLSVRLVAPAADRAHYLSDRLRLSVADATAARDSHDRNRAEYLRAVCGHDITDPTGYDLAINVARLGVDGTADVIVAAVRRKFPDVPA